MEQGKYELIRQSAATLGLALIAAAGIIGYSLPDAPRTAAFEVHVVNGKIVRLDTRNGNIIACDLDRCVRVLGNGKKPQPNSAPGLMPPTRLGSETRNDMGTEGLEQPAVGSKNGP